MNHIKLPLYANGIHDLAAQLNTGISFNESETQGRAYREYADKLLACKSPMELNNLYQGLKLVKQTLPSLSAPTETDTDVNGAISEAIKSKDITPEVGATLKQQYKPTVEDCKKIKLLLKDFAKQRIRLLMTEPFEVLDKEGLLPELKEKFLDGFNIRWIQKYGKPYAGNDKIASKNLHASEVNKILLQYLVDAGYKTEAEANTFEYMAGGDDTLLKTRILDIINNFYNSALDNDWDILDKDGRLPMVKEKAPEIFKSLFRRKFGIEYKGN